MGLSEGMVAVAVGGRDEVREECVSESARGGLFRGIGNFVQLDVGSGERETGLGAAGGKGL